MLCHWYILLYINLLLIPSSVFITLIIVFFRSLWTFIIFALCCSFKFLYPTLKFGEHPQNYIFEFFIKQMTNLQLCRVFSCSFIWEVFFCFILFSFFCIYFFDFLCYLYKFDKITFSPILEKVDLCRSDLCVGSLCAGLIWKASWSWAGAYGIGLPS